MCVDLFKHTESKKLGQAKKKYFFVTNFFLLFLIVLLTDSCLSVNSIKPEQPAYIFIGFTLKNKLSAETEKNTLPNFPESPLKRKKRQI